MKTLRITSGVEINGKHRAEGDIVKNVPTGIAAEIVTAGRAVIVPEKAREIVIPDPAVENRDPQPARRGRPSKAKATAVDAPPEA